MVLEVDGVYKRDILALRENAAWRWFMHEWEEILEELESNLVSEDYPAVYRTQGRVSAILEMLVTIDRLEEEISGTE